MKVKLDEMYERERAASEQDVLASSIWGQPKQVDASWDPEPVDIFDPRPLTVGRVVSELGYKRTPQHVHRIGALVHEAYVNAYGRSPFPRVHYAQDGTPESVSCYTEDDRGLITGVIVEHAELLQLQDPPRVNPID